MNVQNRFRVALVGVLGLVGATLFLVLGGTPAQATHYRATQINWHVVSGNTVEFHLSASWRCTYFFDPCTAAPGDAFFADPIDLGDGEFSDGQWEVVSVDSVNDVITAEAHVEHTYATSGPFDVALASCCRLSGPDHINNPDGDVRVETVVDLAATSANPVSSIPPIVDCAPNAVCQFFVPATDPDGQTMAFRMATTAESALAQPVGASIDPATGKYSWDTTGAAVNAGGSSYYSTQVMVENVVGGNVVTKTPVDFFIRITDTPNNAPVFQSPTPADGTTINGTVGTPLTFSVNATDADSADTVTLGVINKPGGASFTQTPGNPATGSFSWTPSSPGSTVINLTAQDGSGLGAVPRSLTLVIASGINLPPQVTGNSTSVQYSDPLSFTGASASDPEGDAVTMSSSALPAALSGSDDGAGTYTVSGTVTAAPGAYPVTYTAADATHSPTASGTITVTKEDCTLTAPPTIPSSSSGSTTLTATLGEPDASPGDLAGKTVTFAGVDGGGAAVGPFTATTNSAGVASVAAPLGEGAYGFGASFAGDGYYQPCATATDTVVTVSPAGYKVTGGGWVSQGTGRVSFGFNAKSEVTGLTGQLQVRTISNKGRFHGNVVQTLSVTGNTATWTGTGRWNGAAGFTFSVSVVDNGTSGKKGDTISIVIRNAAGSVVFSTGGSSPLKGGNIVVR